MEPKGFLGTWCTIFALTALPFGVLMSTISSARPDGGLVAGFAFGILFGLCMAPLMMGVRAQVPVADRQSFFGPAESEYGEATDYHPKTQQPEYVIYEAVSAGAYKFGPVSLTPTSFFTVFCPAERRLSSHRRTPPNCPQAAKAFARRQPAARAA